MKINSTKNENSTVTLTVVIEPAEWSKEEKNVLNSFKRNANFKGFRKGAVPAAMIRKVYGQEAIDEAAVELFIRKNLDRIIDEQGLEPIDQIDVQKFEKGEDGVTVDFIIPVAPEAKLGEWKNLGIEKEAVEVTDEEVEKEIENLLDAQAAQDLVEDGEAQEGDNVTVDFTALVEGEETPDEVKEQTVTIGGAGLPEGFSEALTGAKTGDVKEVVTTYGDDAHEALAGKKVTFNITVGDIFRKNKPELNDEFAKTVKDYGENETVDALKENIRKSLLESKEENAEDTYIAKVLEAAAANADVTVPASMIAKEANVMLDTFKRQLGASYQVLLQQTGQNDDGIREIYKPEAEKRLKNSLILEAIARDENITVTDEEVEKYIDEFAADNNVSAADVRKNLDMNSFRRTVLSEKAMDALLAAQETEAAE